MNHILIATWSNGVFEFADSSSHSFAGRSVGAITRSRSGRTLGIVDHHSLVERTAAGKWRDVASSHRPLSCVLCTEEDVYVGTDDAAVLRLSPVRELVPLDGFASIEGRGHWYAGTAVVDGREVGPPLGVRSMSATSDEALLVNVHVGGIPRSVDRGLSWAPTIDIQFDVHEVSAHPEREGDAIAACAVGLCVSTDGGESWTVESAGLHATYCSAARYCEDTIFVAASEQHFSPRGAVYRRAPDKRNEPLERVSGGLPEWLDGIVDTACIGSNGSTVVIVDRGGHVYESVDCGENWSLRADGLASPSAVVVL